ncbi:MAG: PQQ-binding-like beta-propeller repeat protein [Gemmataceae bacterium]
MRSKAIVSRWFPTTWWIGLVGVVAVLPTTSARAEDWPQFLGPRRDATSQETGKLQKWGPRGPKLLWKHSIGESYAGPVVVGKKLLVFYRDNRDEVLECLDAATGKRIWKQTYLMPYFDTYGKGDGPRGTPTVVNGRIYLLGVAGQLSCYQLYDGKKLWTRNVKKDYKVRPNFFGVGTSPLVDAKGKRVLVNVGGKQTGAGIVAFDGATGKELWKATSDEASYASPIFAKLGKKTFAVFFTRFGAVLLDPNNGKVVHRQRWRAEYSTSVNAATPLHVGNYLFFSTCYETGALLLKLDEGKLERVWSNDISMSNHFNTCVYRDGFLFGCHGRQERRPKLRCVDFKTGKVRWTKPGFGCASMILLQDKIIGLTEGGDLVVFAASPKGYQEISRATVFSDSVPRAQIALSNGRLYAHNGKTLKCWQVLARGTE